MPFPRPTLTSLQNQGLQDIINYNIPGQTALLRRSPLRAINTALAGMTWGGYQYIDYVARESVPFTATGENLLAWGGLVNVLPNPAIAATDGTVTFFGTTGTTIPSATQLTSSDGLRFITTQSGVIQQSGNSNTNGGVTGITAACLNVGQSGNLPQGSSLSLVNPIGGLDATALVNTSFTTGADIEDEELYRSRVLFAFRNPPQGGSLSDYAEWAMQVPGVTRAWGLNGELGAGDIYLYFMADVVNATNNGFPIGQDGVSSMEYRFPPNTTTFTLNGNPNSTMVTAQGDQRTVADYIYPLRPATAYVIVKSPTPSIVNFTFSSFYPPDQTVFNAAYQQLQAFFARVGTPYGVTQTAPGTDDQTGTIYESDYFAALEQTPGIVNFSISQPTGNFTTQTGYLPVVGVCTPPPNVGLLAVGSSAGSSGASGGVGNTNNGGGSSGSGGSTLPTSQPTPGQITTCTEYTVSDPSTQIGIQWNPPSYTGSDVLTYDVVYTLDGGQTFKTLQNSTATYALLTGIAPLTTVYFLLSATNTQNVTGAQSQPFAFQTQAGSNLGGSNSNSGAVVPGPPQSLTVNIDQANQQFTLTWLPPNYGTAPFTYTIEYLSTFHPQLATAGTTTNTYFTITGSSGDVNDAITFRVYAQNVNAVPGTTSNDVTVFIDSNGVFHSS